MAPDRRAEVGAVRSLIRQAAPEAEEAVQWGMLTYRVGGSALVALASQKRHLSLYLLETCSDPEVLEHRGQLAALDMGKGLHTLQAGGRPRPTVGSPFETSSRPARRPLRHSRPRAFPACLLSGDVPRGRYRAMLRARGTDE